LWDFGGSTSNLQTPKFRFVGSGKFKVMLVAISNFGCRDTTYQVITVYPHPTANFSTTPVCIGKESIFKSLSTVGSGSVTDYFWNFGDSSYSSGQIVKHTYTKPGTYNVWLIVKTDKGCTDTLENPMIVYPLPSAKITSSSSTSFCIGGSVVLSAPPGQTTYDWSTGETTSSITVTKPGMYHVKVTNGGGCGSEDSIRVTVWPLPVIHAGRDTTISKGYSVQLHAIGAKTYFWTPSVGLDNDHAGSPVATPLTTTTYIVTGNDTFGCSSTDTITITVIDDHRFHVYNLVTPNGDGQNDTWYIGNIETYQDCEVTIYNRYGQVLYQTTNYKNDWNGTYHGEQLPEGAYFYTIKCPGDDNVYKGSISILRNK
jgi:gliding motility-associated-like protein